MSESIYQRNPEKLDQNSRQVTFLLVNGTNEIAPLPMNPDGSIRIEIIPTSEGTAIATRHRFDENGRNTAFGLSTIDGSNIPLTITNLGGTAPAVRIDMSVL